MKIKVFGAFCDENFFFTGNEQNMFRGSHATFLFVLAPFEQKFESLGINSDHMRCDLEYFSFGGGGYFLFY